VFPAGIIFSRKNIICVKDCESGPLTFLILMEHVDIQR